MPLFAIQAEVNQFVRIPATRLEALTRTIGRARNQRRKKIEGHEGMTMRARKGRLKSDGKAVKAQKRGKKSKHTNWVIIAQIQFPKILDQRNAREGKKSTKNLARQVRSPPRKNQRRSGLPPVPTPLIKFWQFFVRREFASEAFYCACEHYETLC